MDTQIPHDGLTDEERAAHDAATARFPFEYGGCYPTIRLHLCTSGRFPGYVFFLTASGRGVEVECGEYPTFSLALAACVGPARRAVAAALVGRRAAGWKDAVRARVLAAVEARREHGRNGVL